MRVPRPRTFRMLRSAATLLALALVPALSPAQASPDIDAAAQAVRAKVVEWRRDLHQHPELGNEEVRTARVVADHLRALGLEPRTGIGPTGVTAVLKGGRPGPRIALRADMDALPVTEATGLPFASTVRREYCVKTVWAMHAFGNYL